MNIHKAITLGRKKLALLENPSLEAEVILAHTLKQNRTWLKINRHKKLNLVQQLQYRWFLHQRNRKVPVAYITKHVEWNGLNLNVNAHTLIPRDETETLCHHISKNFRLNTTPPLEEYTHLPSTILDIGTGSGCIAIYMAQQYPEATVSALDINPKTLKVAKKNTQQHNVHINFILSDLLSAIEPYACYNIIVANLPYVPSSTTVTAEVHQEPANAIFSGADGLDHIRQLQQQLHSKSINFDQLWLEFLPSQTAAIKTIFSDYKVVFYPAVDGQIFFACITGKPTEIPEDLTLHA